MFAPKVDDRHSQYSRPLTLNTHHALLSVNQRMARSTTYKDQFPSSSPGVISQASSLFHSRCASADTRGKYSRGVSFSFSLPPQQRDEHTRPSTTGSIRPESYSRRLFLHQLTSQEKPGSENDPTRLMHVQQSQDQEQTYPIMVDKGTQTEECVDDMGQEGDEVDYWEEGSIVEDKKHTDTLQTLASTSDPKEASLPAPRPPSIESFLDSETTSSSSHTPDIPPVSTIRPFSQSEAQRTYHSQHPELVPDLREVLIRTGKRHTFSGYNAHYWH